jgi:hypothetical protein
MKTSDFKAIVEHVVKKTLQEMDSMLGMDASPTTTGLGVPEPVDPVEKQRQELKAKKAGQDQVKKIDKTLKIQGTQEKLRQKSWKLTKRNLEKEKNSLKRPTSSI